MPEKRAAALGAALLAMAFALPAAAQSALPAGQYHCLTSNFTLSRGVTYELSVLGRLILDGRGTYQVSATGNSGRYEVSGATFVFASGPLQGWPAVVETIGGQPRIRMGKTRETPPNPKGAATGEHRCTLRE
jgi:hypothetical protein